MNGGKPEEVIAANEKKRYGQRLSLSRTQALCAARPTESGLRRRAHPLSFLSLSLSLSLCRGTPRKHSYYVIYRGKYMGKLWLLNELVRCTDW